jgi:hypothetical protein
MLTAKLTELKPHSKSLIEMYRRHRTAQQGLCV